MNIEAETYYERCRALISVIGTDIDENDRAALIAVLEDYFDRLGEAIRTR